MNQRILVTGSRGLIGRTLCPALRKAGFEVIEFDLAIAPGELGHGDVRDIDACIEAVSQVQGVIHLAAVSRVVWGERDPVLCRAVNAAGSIHLIKACEAAVNRPWLVMTSSREVYGQQTQLPVPEYAQRQPLNVYAQSKADAKLAAQAAAQRGLRVGYVRLSSVYGDTLDHKTRVVPAFVLAALQAEPLRVDDERGVLDFTHVDDVVAGLIAFAMQIAQGKKISPIHFVSGHGTTLIELASMIVQLCNSASLIVPGTPRTYDVARFIGDPGKALTVLGWAQRTPLQAGIKKLIAEHQQNCRHP